jgi:hypothetical protein
MRPLVLLLCAALLAPAFLLPAKGRAEQPRAKKPRTKAAAQAPKAVEQPRLNPADLTAPYSALRRGSYGPAPEGARQGAGRPDLQDSYQSNATSWKLDLSLDPKRQEDGSPLRFHLGRETALDPVTKKELTPRADPLKAQQSLKDLNLKGALENLGGKAEVQVDVLKF